MAPNEIPRDGAADAGKPARQRIAKLMARAGLCSRRDAEAWIVEGRVSVNDTVLTSPAVDVAPQDKILVDGVPLPGAQKTRLFLFHKPHGLITSDRDPEGRATVADFLRAHWPEGPRVVTIGRLDFNTEGLLLLTNDGGLARVLELPKTGWLRRYRVRAKGETDQAVLDGLRSGVTIDGVDYAGIEATLDRVQGANVWLTMGLREGKNREVKRVLESIGLEVNRLIRVSFGPFQLGDLPEGAVEEVRTRILRDQLGATLAAAAGATFDDMPAESKPVRQTHTAAAERPRRDGRRDAPRGERSGERPRRSPREEVPPPIRQRPLAGTRKHVSTMRAAGNEAAQHGPRRRIERSDVTDRKDRAVRVERVVGARPAPAERKPSRQRAETARPDARRERPVPRDRQDARRDRPDRGTEARRTGPKAPGRRDGRPERPDQRDAMGRRHASPSALAKRARTAKSAGMAETGENEAAGRGSRRDAPPAGRRGRPAGNRMPSNARATRRPDRNSRDEARGDGKRQRAATGEPRREPRRATGEKRFGRKPSGPEAGRGVRAPREAAETRKPARSVRDGSGKRGAGNPRPKTSGRDGGTRPKTPGGDRRPPRGPAPRTKR